MQKILIFFQLILMIFIFQVTAQTISIEGRVTSIRFPVKQASVTFIDVSDTTNKYSAVTDDMGNYQIGLPTSIKPIDNNLPSDFQLAQNYPNPFSASTNIPYNVNKQSDIKITIFDILGREVRQFTVGLQNAGIHKVSWDGRNSLGQKVANGIYLYKLDASGKSQVKKMILNSGTQTFNSGQQINLPKMPSAIHKTNKLSAGVTYNVRIGNTEDTSPNIIPQQIDNLQVNNDTTINFQVSYIPTATIDFNEMEQTIRGFGAANILPWRPDMTDSEIQTAFGTGEGELGFTILRLMVQPNSGDWSRNVATAKKAYDMGAIIFASPWNAPGDMVESANGVTRVRHDMYEEYAAHLDSFATFMSNNGVPLYGISIQNEPDYGEWTRWTADEMFIFMRDYAHLITETRVIAPESFQFRRNMSDPILNDSVASSNLDIVGGHIYGGGLASYPLAEQKGKEVWMTEYLINSNDPPTDLDVGWTGAMQTAESINGCLNAGMSAYVWWYIVRYYGPIADGTYATKGEVTMKGQVMSQFARFIRPGEHRVYSDVAPVISNVSVTAYKDSLSSKAVMIAVNTSSSDKDLVIKLNNSGFSNFITYTTSEFKNVVQGEDTPITNNKIEYNLDASSITTFILN